jgi:poly(3-hydroxyalkanoate) synthetase
MLHLTLALLTSTSSRDGSRNSSGDWPSWSADPAEQVALLVEALRVEGATAPKDILLEAMRRDRALIAGIAGYRRHPWHRDLPDPPAMWREGGSRLLDYGGAGPPMLLVPSLINRAYVLDLAAGRSLARWFAANGVRTLLLDWGWPGEIERGFTLTDYIAGRLERAMASVGAPVVLAGYCMGGLLAVAAALRRPDLARALVLMATPWDFHAVDRERALALARAVPFLEPALALAKTLPIDALQMLFTMVQPDGVALKYRAFAKLDPGSERANMFVALEDWLNDGVPLAAPVARECLTGWYGENRPARGMWRIAGLPVDPAALRVPAFIAIPRRDRIVPPESARKLAALIPGAAVVTPAAGHIGMVAGSAAEAGLWRPLLDWVLAHAG